jgi:hypothetical protein
MTNALRSAPVRGSRRVLRVAARAATATALVVSATVVGFSLSSDDGGRTVAALANATIGAGGEYHALTPLRILDTREANLDVAPFGRKPFQTASSDGLFNVPVVDRAGLGPFHDGNGDCADDNVLAVAVTITVVNPTSVGYLEAFGKGENHPATSIVNFKPGAVVANTAVLRPGCDGELSVRLAPAAAATGDVLIDIFGWFSSSSYVNASDPGARLEPSGPGRIYDSRETAFGAHAFGPAEQRELTIWGAKAFDTGAEVVVNSSNVVAVLLNVTGVNANPGSANTFVSLLPAPVVPGEQVSTSNLNLVTGQVRSNMAIVPVSADGKIWVYNANGNNHVVVDVMGYFLKNQDPSTSRGRVIPLVAPFRAFDTREAAFADQPLPPAYAEDWSFQDFAQDVKVNGQPLDSGQIGLIGNLTAAALGRQYDWAPTGSYVTAYPTPSGGGAQSPPLISNLGIKDGETVANLVLLKYGSDGTDPYQVRFYNRAGYLDYLLDVTAIVLS